MLLLASFILAAGMTEGVTLTGINPLTAWDRFSGENSSHFLCKALFEGVQYLLYSVSAASCFFCWLLSGSPTTEARMIRDISMIGRQGTIEDDELVDINERKRSNLS